MNYTSTTDSGNCVKSANDEFTDSIWASRLICCTICGDTRGGTCVNCDGNFINRYVTRDIFFVRLPLAV